MSDHNRKDEDASESGGCCACLNPVIEAIQRVVHAIVPPGGILASAFNLASCSIGAGILGLPAATDSAGLILAMILLFIITVLSTYSMHIIGLSVEKTGIRTYEGMSKLLFPKWNYAFSYVATFIRVFHGFAAEVAYVISAGNCFSPMFKEAHKRDPDNAALEYFDTTNGNRLIVVLLWLFLMVPLVIPRHVDSLRYASSLAITMIMYFVVTIIVHSAMNGLPKNRHNVHLHMSHYEYQPGNNIYLFRSGNPIVQTTGVFIFAYVCQVNAYEVMVDMAPGVRSTRNFTWASILAMAVCGTLYAMVCIFGYFDFGSNELDGQSILLMYNPVAEPQIMVAYIGVLLKVCVAYALLTSAARNSIYYMIGWQDKYRSPPASAKVESGSSNADSNHPHAPLGFDEAQKIDPAEGEATHVDFGPLNNGDGTTAAAACHEDIDDGSYIDNIPFWRHLLVVCTLSVAALLCGLFIPSINTVFGFAGAISGGSIAFIFPALFHMYSGDFSYTKVGFWYYCSTFALYYAGIIGLVWGTAGTIFNVFTG